MVWLTRFDGTRFVINTDLIESAEATPDTVITLTNGHRFVVCEGVDDLIARVVAFRHRIYTGLGGQE
jgi:flagellar protein FlbD